MLAIAMASTTSAFAADKDIEALKKELFNLKNASEQRIQALEKRVENAEEQSEETSEQTQQLAIDLSQQSNRKAANTFNPSIGVILNGKFLSTPKDYEFALPGYFLGEEPGPGEQGLALGESELNMSANIDDKFYGSLTLAFGEETEVEEAYIQTLNLPNGLGIKAGRFFSGIGYLNSHHAHTDDFSVRPLAYQAFLGPSFGDDGLQLTWLAPTDLYWETGVELYRGESFPAAGADNQGKGVKTLFTHIGGDITLNQSWRAGVSWLKADVDGRESDGNESFSGNSELWLADFVWKWSPNGNAKDESIKIQGEYFTRTEKGDFTDSSSVTSDLDHKQNGWYVQSVYQFMPQWRVGLRYEELSSDALPAAFDGTILDDQGHDPQQVSAMVDWSNSEFSRIRLQYMKDEASPKAADLYMLQYIVSFGAHGAHSF